VKTGPSRCLAARSGKVFAATRRAYDQLSPEHPLMVAIDMSNIALH
jgi:hypothetical protein